MSELLRELPADDVRALCQQAAASLGFPDAGFVEKDFWAMEVLRSLSRPFEVPDSATIVPVFKGGTSLSKAFGYIQRFSDDIDVVVVPDRRVSGRARAEQYLKPLTARVAEDLGLTTHRCEPVASGKAHRNTRFFYPSFFPEGTHSPGVLLEMSFRDGSSTLPGVRHIELRSSVAEYLGQQAAQFADATAFTAAVLSPARTLLEKLSAIVGMYDEWVAGRSEKLAKGARHFYDVHQLLISDEVLAELATLDVEEVCAAIESITAASKLTTGSRPTGGFAVSPAFDPDGAFTRAAQAEYAAVEGLTYGDFPALERCLSVVARRANLL